MKTRFAYLATIALALPAHASITGSTVTASYVVPPGTIYVAGTFSVQAATVGDALEFAAFGTSKNLQIDFSDDKVTISTTKYGRTIYGVGTMVFDFANAQPISGVSVLDPGVSMYTNYTDPYFFDQSRISFSDHTISLDMTGLSVPGTSVLQLSISTSPVPELASNWLFAMGLFGLGLSHCRRRRCL